MKATAIGWLVLVLAAAAPLPAQARQGKHKNKHQAAQEAAAAEQAAAEQAAAEQAAAEQAAAEQAAAEQAAAEQAAAEQAAAEQPADGEPEPEAEADDANASRTWYFGPFVRYTILPAFMLKLGLAEAPTVANPSIGIAANHRNPDGASFELGLGYTGLGFHGPMRAKGDPDQDTEWIDSSLWLLHATASIYWTAGIIDKLSFEYGLGIDFGLMLGELKRTEAYPSGGGYARCPGPILVPLPNSDYCANPPVTYDKKGEHYGVVQEDMTPIGGNLMIPHLALRYEPIPELAVKLEGALGFPMFFIGLSAAYGPEL